MLLKLILEMLKHVLRSQHDLLVEMAVVVHLQEQHGALTYIVISVLAVEPLLYLLCEFFVIHICENLKGEASHR